MLFNLSQQVGEEYKYNHEKCGDTRQRLYIKRNHSGWLYHCFNCGWSGFKKAGQVNSLTDIKEYLNDRQSSSCGDDKSDSDRRNLSLPFDCTHELPVLATHWFRGYGITDEEAKQYHFRHSPKLSRLILPLYNKGGELIFWQGRTLRKPSKDNPKYINVTSKKNDYAILNPKCNTVVLVEDILSSIKVARQVASIPILGSYVSTSLLQYLKGYDTIYCWLDMDKRFDSLRYSQKIRLLTGKPCSSIITKLDPKEYTDEEIHVYLK